MKDIDVDVDVSCNFTWLGSEAWEALGVNRYVGVSDSVGVVSVGGPCDTVLLSECQSRRWWFGLGNM